jgi:hypothetical protein
VTRSNTATKHIQPQDNGSSTRLSANLQEEVRAALCKWLMNYVPDDYKPLPLPRDLKSDGHAVTAMWRRVPSPLKNRAIQEFQTHHPDRARDYGAALANLAWSEDLARPAALLEGVHQEQLKDALPSELAAVSTEAEFMDAVRTLQRRSGAPVREIAKRMRDAGPAARSKTTISDILRRDAAPRDRAVMRALVEVLVFAADEPRGRVDQFMRVWTTLVTSASASVAPASVTKLDPQPVVNTAVAEGAPGPVEEGVSDTPSNWGSRKVQITPPVSLAMFVIGILLAAVAIMVLVTQ